MVMRTWVNPDGVPHDVSDEELWDFCTQLGLHYSNMVYHIATPTSDQRDEWRLIERLTTEVGVGCGYRSRHTEGLREQLRLKDTV